MDYTYDPHQKTYRLVCLLKSNVLILKQFKPDKAEVYSDAYPAYLYLPG